jgi:predicted Zn-dependent protease
MRACTESKQTAFTTAGNKFTVPVIYWHLADTTTDMTGIAVIEAFRGAFAAWQPYLNPVLESTSEIDKANIIINFAIDGDDDLPEPFGAPGVLAYAYFPVNNFSSMWFDDSENWGEMHTSTRIYLKKVVVHELGHSLGLGHTQAKDDVMRAYYEPDNYIRISQDSIDGLASLYGEVVAEPEPEPEPEPRIPQPPASGGCMVPIVISIGVSLLAYYNF